MVISSMTLLVEYGRCEGHEEPVKGVAAKEEHKDFAIFASKLLISVVVCEAGALAVRFRRHWTTPFSLGCYAWKNSPKLAVALNCGIGSMSLNDEVKAF